MLRTFQMTLVYISDMIVSIFYLVSISYGNIDLVSILYDCICPVWLDLSCMVDCIYIVRLHLSRIYPVSCI